MSMRSTLKALLWDGDMAYAVGPDGSSTRVNLYVAADGHVVARAERFDNGNDQDGRPSPIMTPLGLDQH